MTEKIDKEMQQEMELQLHEQYAINNNANLGSVVSLIITMLAVLGAYGYVYLHSSCDITDLGHLCVDGQFSLTAVIITAMAVMFILYVMYRICLYQGVAQRKEQFIIYAIRKKYGLEPDGTILPKSYHPFNKCCLKVVQGLYGEIIKLLVVTFVLVIVSLIAKICYTGSCRCAIISVLIIFCLILIVRGCCIFCETIKSYNNHQDQYKDIKP